MLSASIDSAVGWIVDSGASLVLPIMVGLFVVGIALRFLVTFTVTRETWFAREFEKRVLKFVDEAKEHKNLSFYLVAKRCLEKTYYELFIVRGIMKRRKPDAVRSLTDRMFLIQHGCARLVDDTLRRIRFLPHDGSDPRLDDTSKAVFEYNPCFRRVFGVIPIGGANDFLSILPGIFIVGGIFGTFLGIMKALPELAGMNLGDAEGTKAVMDDFLVKIAFSMGKSVVGILLSVCQSVLNTFYSAERPYLNAIDKYTHSLTCLWNRSSHNEVPADVPEFDEHKDPIDALAQDSVMKELERKVMFIPKAG